MRNLFVGLCLSALAAGQAQARRVTPDDAGFVVESFNETLRGSADGRYTTETEIIYRVLNPIGAERAGLQRLSFNSSTQKLTLIEAYTVNGDQKIPVDPTNVETRSISATGVGFDDQKRMLIPFPQLVPGSKIVLHSKLETHTPSLKDVLQGRLYVPNNVWVEKFEMNLEVPANTRVELRDPRKTLRVRKSTPRAGFMAYKLSAKQIPAEGALGEDDRAPDPDEELWVNFSSLKQWSELSDALTVEYEKVLAEPLPPKFAAIVKKFRGLEPNEAIPKMWEAFIREVRYFGDWRTVKGAYIPRPLKLIADSGFGDCKDFAVLLSKGLRELGYDAHPIIIDRDSYPTVLGELPVMNAFNHAVSVLHLNDATYFVDGTNPVPHFKVLPDDIAGRSYLSLSTKPGQGGLQRTPDNQAADSTWSTQLEIDPETAPTRRMKVTLHLTGGTSWSLQNYLFGKTEGQTRDAFLGYLRIPDGTLSDFKFISLRHRHAPAFESDIVFSLVQNYGIRRAGDLLIYNMDPMGDVISVMNTATQNRISALRVDDPSTKTLTVRIPRREGLEPIGVPYACHVEAPWFDFNRKVSEGEQWVVEDTFSNSAARILPKEIDAKKFREIQSKLRECLFKVDAVFRKKGADKTES